MMQLLPSDNPLRFRKNSFGKNVLEWIYNKTMMINDQIKEEKPKYGISREAEKILALSSGKIDKYKYLTGEKISYFNQKQITEQAKSTYLPLGKFFEKETKSINDTGKDKLRIYTL